jgi:hypothetical protein
MSLRKPYRPEEALFHMSMQAQEIKREKQFEESGKKFEKLINELSSGETLKLNHSELESMLNREGLKLLRQLMQDHLDLRSAREERRENVIGADTIVRSQVKKSERGLMTIFGPVNVSRLAYAAVGRASLHPLDAALNLPTESYSYGVRQRLAEEVAKASFDEALVTIKKTTGATLAKRQAEELAQRAAQDFELFYQQRQQQPESQSSSILVLSTDGKGIVVRKDDLRAQTRKSADKENHKMHKRISKGEKRNRKRMAQVAAVYTIAPHMRSAEDIVAELRPVSDATISRPKPEQKRVWASIENRVEEVISQAFSEACWRDPKQEKKWVILIDGNPIQLEIITNKIAKLKRKPIIILDIIHVLEYLWKAAFAFCGEASQAAQDWVTVRLLAILQGKYQGVAAGMRRSATLQGLTTKARAAVDTCADYLLKYRCYLRYDQYLNAGLPIATGIIEGACRHLIQDRMDITGARWSLKGAEAILRLRSLRSSKDFDDYWRFHLIQEFQRNHVKLYLNGAVL